MTQEPSGGKQLGWAGLGWGRRRGSPRGRGQSQQGFWALEKMGSSLLDQEKQGGEKKKVSGFRELLSASQKAVPGFSGGFTEPPKQDP